MDQPKLYIPPNKRNETDRKDVSLIPTMFSHTPIDAIAGFTLGKVTQNSYPASRTHALTSWKKIESDIKSQPAMTPEQAGWQNRYYLRLKSSYIRYCRQCGVYERKSTNFDSFAGTLYRSTLKSRVESDDEISIDTLMAIVK